MSLDYYGKGYTECRVCRETKKTIFYWWHTIFDPEKRICCHRCALREYGKTYVNAIKEKGSKNES